MIVKTIEGWAAKLNEWIEPVKDFIFENHNNPIMWLIIFIAGLAIFGFTYSALSKEK